MSRWHKSHCSAPNVSISLRGIPRCKTCLTQCPLKNLIAAKKENPPLTIPPNEPSGEMKLWWPQSVPYTTSKAEEKSAQAIAPTNLNSHLKWRLTDDNEKLGKRISKRDPPSQNSEATEPTYLPIYGPTLGTDEFRLICVSAAKNNEDVIHVDLEVYSHTNCPEYETVSYTWGGEDGDYTLCRPIYVGPYWDVALQPKNCWEMLRFVRPGRGIRMVWVDALCINQGNVTERGAQVAKMGQIYEQCSRVIVYLGPDFVTPDRGNFPLRRLIHEIGSDSIHPQLPDGFLSKKSHIDLQEILKRNYFSRVWVIQELMFSQRAVIRVGNIDFCADSTGFAHLKTTAKWKDWEWDSTAAPWVQYMARKAFPSQNIYEVLRLTSQSRASDPRDKIFGVLGLINHDSLESGMWTPEYSLSPQHIFIGLVASLIINLQMHHILKWAAGLSAPTSSPSWMPNWVEPEFWERIFSTPRPKTKEIKSFISKNVLLDPGYHLNHLGESATTPGRHPPPPPVWQFSKDWVDTVISKRPWNYNMSVNSSTGALSINLMHLSAISFRPVLIEKHGKLSIIEVKTSKLCLYLATENLLEDVRYPGDDHLFILVADDYTISYFILRDLGSGSYRFITSCADLFMVELGEEDSRSSVNSWLHVDSLYREIEKICLWHDEPSCLHGLAGYGSMTLGYIAKFREKYNDMLKGLLPGMKSFWELIPVYRGLFNERDGSDPDFKTLYWSSISQEFQPRIIDGFLELSFKSKEFHKTRLPYYEGNNFERDSDMVVGSPDGEIQVHNPWEWRRSQKEKWTSINSKSPKHSHLSPTVYLRAPMTEIRAVFEHLVAPIARIKRVLGTSFDEVEDLIRNGPRENHRLIGSAVGKSYEGREMQECWDLNFDVDVRQVKIL